MSRISEFSYVASRGVACRVCDIKRGIRWYPFDSEDPFIQSIDIPLCKSCVADQIEEAERLRKAHPDG